MFNKKTHDNQLDMSSLSKEALIAELKKDKEIITMFSNTVMGGVAKMDLATMGIITATEGYYEMTGYTKEESILPPFNNCGLNLVIPEDMSIIQNKLNELITLNKPIRVAYRIRKKNGDIAWNTAFCPGVQNISGKKIIEIFFLDTTQSKKTELQLSSLINHMSSGLVIMQVDDEIHITFANDEFYHQIGYSHKSFTKKTKSHDYLQIVDKEDIPHLKEVIHTFIKSDDNSVVTDYRILRGDHQTRWIRAHLSHLYGDYKDNNIQCILTDVTKEKENDTIRRLNEERFRIISEQTKDVIFEWNIHRDTISYSSVFQKMFGCPPPIKSTKQLIASAFVHPDDKAIMQNMIDNLRHHSHYLECKIRLQRSDGTYFWTLQRATAIRDKNAKFEHVVGIISDVDDLMTNALNLKRKAEHDPLTNLLNRSAGQLAIESIIMQQKDHKSQCAFIQFDIDRFKQINDFMGHAAGDVALQSIAQLMRDTFVDDDILIRMGGDEFAIFISKPCSQPLLIENLENFVHTVSCDFKYEGKLYPLSISLGIAFYPEDGHTFDELYKQADNAMYEAKKNGGNTCISNT